MSKNCEKTFFVHFGRVLLAGLAALVPLIGTVWMLVIVYRVLLMVGEFMVMGVMKGLSFLIGDRDAYLGWKLDFPGANLTWFLLPVLLTVLVGLAVLNKPGRRVLSWFNRVVQRLPVVGFIYSALRQFVDAIRGLGEERKFQSVVYVEYPSPGCKLMGFVTGNFKDEQTGEGVTSVFVPTSPNPMTGFLIVVDDDKLIESGMSVEKATKLVLSAGLVTPEK